MHENLKFSVSMCVYGGDNARWFETAIESVLNQTLPPNEIVLVVDGPVPDDLNAVILKLEENDTFKVIRLETNQGHGIARKTGLDKCTNELVAIMDADDICTRNRFEKQMFMRVPVFRTKTCGYRDMQDYCVGMEDTTARTVLEHLRGILSGESLDENRTNSAEAFVRKNCTVKAMAEHTVAIYQDVLREIV